MKRHTQQLRVIVQNERKLLFNGIDKMKKTFCIIILMCVYVMKKEKGKKKKQMIANPLSMGLNLINQNYKKNHIIRIAVINSINYVSY